jgi:hypothetical protein
MSHIAVQSENLLRRERHKKNTIEVLVGGMCGWHVRSNTQQRQMPGLVPFIMPCIARDTSDLELPVFLYSLDFLLLFDHAKSKKNKIFIHTKH